MKYTPDDLLLKAVINGTRPLADLSRIRIKFHLEKFDGGVRCWVDGWPCFSLGVGLRELTWGLLNHLQDRGALRKWALFINAARIHFCPDEDPIGETLLESLHDASFATPIQPAVVAKLRNYANSIGTSQ